MQSYDYINKVKKFKGLGSDYQIAKLMGWSKNKVSQYKHGTSMDNDAARQVAQLLDIPVWKVIADMEIQRLEKQGKSEEAKAWHKLSKEAGYATASLLITNVIILLSASYYILCKIAQQKKSLLNVSA